MAYDDPNATVNREWFAGEAGGAATTEYGKYKMYQKCRLMNVHAVVTTAGTATAHGFDVYVGTTSVGTIPLGTSAAGVSASSGKLATSVSSLANISVKSLADATGKAHIIYETEVDHDATKTE